MKTERLLASSAVVLFSCGQPAPEMSQPPAAPPSLPVAVELTRVVAQEVSDPILATGVIAADKTTDVAATVGGVLEEVLVEVGDRVRRGQVLFRVRGIDYRLAVEEAKASVALAAAELEKCRLDRLRVEELRREHVVSEERLDTVSTAQRIAEAKLDKARAELAQAEQALLDTVVRAPYGGVVTRRFADEGSIVRAAPGSAGTVLQLMKVDRVVVVAYVPETALPRIHLDTPAIVHIDGVGREYRSSVAIINDLVEDSSHAVEIRIPLANETLEIKPGLFAKIELRPGCQRVLAVDERALLGPADAPYVYVERRGEAVRRPVQVGDSAAGRIEVLAGLEEGETVLLGEGLERLEDGSPVEVRSADATL